MGSPETSLDFGFERTGFRAWIITLDFSGMFNWPKFWTGRLVQG